MWSFNCSHNSFYSLDSTFLSGQNAGQFTPKSACCLITLRNESAYSCLGLAQQHCLQRKHQLVLAHTIFLPLLDIPLTNLGLSAMPLIFTGWVAYEDPWLVVGPRLWAGEAEKGTVQKCIKHISPWFLDYHVTCVS